MNLMGLIRRKKNKQLLNEAIALEHEGKTDAAVKLYREIIRLDPDWSTPYYNLGLIHKYRCEWPESFEYNRKAAELDPTDEASHWNLGIAATALKNWAAARQAWNFFGMDLPVNDEEPEMNMARSPIRLNPDEGGEVVWCLRVDPARAIIENVPLPASGHRYNDLVLNDGAPVGHRIVAGREYPVFNELQLIQPSSFKTYSTVAVVSEQEHIDMLRVLCGEENIGFEDWSTINYLCKKCSEGIPHEQHDYAPEPGKIAERTFGFGSISRESLAKVLDEWSRATACEYGDLELGLD